MIDNITIIYSNVERKKRNRIYNIKKFVTI